jgi:hypothetical protein
VNGHIGIYLQNITHDIEHFQAAFSDGARSSLRLGFRGRIIFGTGPDRDDQHDASFLVHFLGLVAELESRVR